MKHHYNYWIGLHHDTNKPIGGVKQIHRLVEALNTLGRKATIIQESTLFHPGWFESQVNTVSLEDFMAKKDLNPKNDVLIIPETYIKRIGKYFKGIPKIIFNQNGSYTFGAPNTSYGKNPKQIIELYNHKDVIHVICVSKYDEDLLVNSMGLGAEKVSRLINGIETNIFYPGKLKSKTIAFMPRKNIMDAQIVTTLLSKQSWFKENNWELLAINKLSHLEVAKQLQNCLCFLSFGHPEGFGLPLAEAAACGCYLIGYSGLGGREIFDLAVRNSSGEEVDYGNWSKFLSACQNLDKAMTSNSSNLSTSLLQTAKEISIKYSREEMKKSVATSLERWEAQLP